MHAMVALFLKDGAPRRTPMDDGGEGRLFVYLTNRNDCTYLFDPRPLDGAFLDALGGQGATISFHDSPDDAALAAQAHRRDTPWRRESVRVLSPSHAPPAIRVALAVAVRLRSGELLDLTGHALTDERGSMELGWPTGLRRLLGRDHETCSAAVARIVLGGLAWFEPFEDADDRVSISSDETLQADGHSKRPSPLRASLPPAT